MKRIHEQAFKIRCPSHVCERIDSWQRRGKALREKDSRLDGVGLSLISPEDPWDTRGCRNVFKTSIDSQWMVKDLLADVGSPNENIESVLENSVHNISAAVREFIKQRLASVEEHAAKQTMILAYLLQKVGIKHLNFEGME